MGATLQHFLGKFDEFKTLPTGESFSIQVSDQEATAAADEYLTENKAQVTQLLQRRQRFWPDARTRMTLS